MSEPRKKKFSPLVAAALIVSTTAVGMAWMGRATDEDEEGRPADGTSTEVIEVEPIVPQARIANASWRTDGDPGDRPTEASASPSETDDPWANLDPKGNSKEDRARSLRKALEKVQGLGVVVAEEDDEKEADGKKPRER